MYKNYLTPVMIDELRALKIISEEFLEMLGRAKDQGKLTDEEYEDLAKTKRDFLNAVGDI